MSSDYYLYCVILKDCGYSEAAHNLLKTYPKIKKEFTFVERTNMEKYKTDKINTFPQIYLKRYNTNGTHLIGGYSEFKNIIDTFSTDMDKDTYTKKINKYISDNKGWSRKTLLRVIELINL